MAAASLTINVMARTRQFTKGMKKAGQATAGLVAKVRILKGSLAALAAPLAALAGAAGFGLLARNSLITIDALAKTSDKLGIATEKLAGLQHAAELTGVESRTLNMGLQRMVRRISEAARGTGEAQGALQELGLSAQQLNMLAPDRQFTKIAEALKNVQNPADRVRLAFKLFDSEGVNLVNTLALGEKGLAAAQEEAERLGLAVSRFDAAQVEKVNDAFTRIKRALTGVVNTVVIKAAPFVEKLADKFVGLVTQTEGFGNAVEEAFGNAVLFIARVIDGVVSLKNTFTNFRLNPFGRRTQPTQQKAETFYDRATRFLEKLKRDRLEAKRDAAKTRQVIGQSIAQALGGGIAGRLRGAVGAAAKTGKRFDPGLAPLAIRGTQEAETIISRALSARANKQLDLAKENNQQNDEMTRELKAISEKLSDPVQLAAAGLF